MSPSLGHRSSTAIALLSAASFGLAAEAVAQPEQEAPPSPEDGEVADDPDEPYEGGSPAPAPPPRADPLAKCVQAFRSAQKLRRQGKLLESRQELTSCAQPRCPSVLSNRCVQWHREVAEAIPTIVVAAKDSQGRDTLDVQVRAGGELLVRRLDGRAVRLNPGMHVLRFEHPGSPVIRRMVVLTEGERNRRVSLSFTRAPTGWNAAIPPPTQDDASRTTAEPIWPLTIASFSLAGTGLVVGTATGIAALSERAAVAEDCPDDRCPDDLRADYRHAATLARVSTLSFIAAGVGTSVGIVSLFLKRPPSNDTARIRPSIGLGSARLTVSLP